MKYVIGIDLGTSAVKMLLVDRNGNIISESARHYPLLQERSGYSEQRPEDWVQATVDGLAELINKADIDKNDVEGISFSGQMHGLVLLDQQLMPLRNAILWNDTRTTKQCRFIEAALGNDLFEVTRNYALEGFTLPKLLWVKEHEPELYDQTSVFLLPKDYVRYRLTGEIAIDYSDAAGTLMLDVRNKKWSGLICSRFGIDRSICPPLVESNAFTGTLLPEIAKQAGLSERTKVFAGGADNACGAVGAGILSTSAAMCSIGTSGVILTYEHNKDRTYGGNVHFFNHAQSDAYYAMGVTLSAGHSLAWFRDTFAKGQSFERLLQSVGDVPVGARGLLYTPYLTGERTPHADANIRGSFIGMDTSHTIHDFTRAVMEGITFSLHESVELFREAGSSVDRIVSIGGGAKNNVWLQMQADIFNAEVVPIQNEQGPGMGAAMLAATGCGWYDSLSTCASSFIRYGNPYTPRKDEALAYNELFEIYKDVYNHTRDLNERLDKYRI